MPRCTRDERMSVYSIIQIWKKRITVIRQSNAFAPFYFSFVQTTLFVALDLLITSYYEYIVELLEAARTSEW